MNSEPEHDFEKKGFWLGKYTVTQEEWKKVGANRKEENHFSSEGGGKDEVKGLDTSRFPAENIGYTECDGFVEKVDSYGKKKFKRVMLPNEDEWEYACRGGKGNGRAFYWGDTLNGDKANCDGNFPSGTDTKGVYKQRTMPVGSYEKETPHPWGLCDMSGNVWQWCDSGQKNQILRGGSWSNIARHCRSAYSFNYLRAFRFHFVGFRLALLD